MPGQLILSERDANRIQQMLRWFEHHRNTDPKFRRRNIAGAGQQLVWAKVITSLKYADPTDEECPDGVSEYTVRPLSSDDSADDITVKGIATEGDYISKDLRNWARWFLVDDIVPLVKRGDDWYIFQTMIPCGSESKCSLRWDEDDGRLMAVFR